MKRCMLVSLLALLCAGWPAVCAGDWTIVWQDEFDGPAGAKPDPDKWAYDLGANGWGNRELQNYTSDAANASHDGFGNLVIRAMRSPNGPPYTSARIKTLGKFSFKYGKVEARLKVPFGQGIWPAFWAMGEDLPTIGWPKCGEIDLMENIGKEPFNIHGTVHGPGYSGAANISFRYTFPGGARASDDFHVYSAEWGENRITFAVDGVTYGLVIRENLPPGGEWTFDKPFFLLLNLAVGGEWPGYPDNTTTFPQDLTVDWVRVSKLETPPDAGTAHRRK